MDRRLRLDRSVIAGLLAAITLVVAFTCALLVANSGGGAAPHWPSAVTAPRSVAALPLTEPALRRAAAGRPTPLPRRVRAAAGQGPRPSHTAASGRATATGTHRAAAPSGGGFLAPARIPSHRGTTAPHRGTRHRAPSARPVVTPAGTAVAPATPAPSTTTPAKPSVPVVTGTPPSAPVASNPGATPPVASSAQAGSGDDDSQGNENGATQAVGRIVVGVTSTLGDTVQQAGDTVQQVGDTVTGIGGSLLGGHHHGRGHDKRDASATSGQRTAPAAGDQTVAAGS